MVFSVPLLFGLSLCLSAEVESHATSNSLFRGLLDPGLAISATELRALPAPTMNDGIPADRQRAIIQELVQSKYDVNEFLRRSLVAPYFLQIRDLPYDQATGRVKAIDLTFVAYGNFDRLRSDDEGVQLFKNATDGRIHEFTAEELAFRSIALQSRPDFAERFVFSSFEILEKVLLSGVHRVVITKTSESVVAASEMDLRFNKDAEFGNSWRPLLRDATAETKLGEPLPYQGIGSYCKITKLHQPAEALLCEYHVVFLEPQGWFGGANLLQSKLPIAVQTEVRNVRRKLSERRD